MVTIKDVARAADVSIATVSNVLNAPERVSRALRHRVLAEVERLGYRPHAGARSLRRGSTRLVGLVVADITNPFFTEFVDGFEEAATAKGYSVLLCNSNEQPSREAAHLQALIRQRQVDALVVAPTQDPDLDSLRRLDLPLVLIDRVVPGQVFDSVRLDSHSAARDATRHMIGLGHRRIALVNGPTSLSTGRDRLAGYRQALSEGGIAWDPALVRDAGYREKEAFRATLDLLESAAPTAIFPTNNLMTIGVMRALSTRGLRCPADVSVVGIDDFAWSEAFTPRLTVVAQPVRAMAEAAMGLLLERLSGTSPPASDQLFPGILKVRDSCAAPRHTPARR